MKLQGEATKCVTSVSGLAFECSGSVGSSTASSRSILRAAAPGQAAQALSIPDSRRVSLLDVPHPAPSLPVGHQVLVAGGRSGSVLRVLNSCCFLLERRQRNQPCPKLQQAGWGGGSFPVPQGPGRRENHISLLFHTQQHRGWINPRKQQSIIY